MILCNNPIMSDNGFPAQCYNGLEVCCRYCDHVLKCLYSGSDLCPYIKSDKDLRNKCPFEFEAKEE